MNKHQVGTVDWLKRECELLSIPGDAKLRISIRGEIHEIEGLSFNKENAVDLTSLDLLPDKVRKSLQELHVTQRVDKVWGYEQPIVNTPDYCGKKMVLREGFRCSLHYHQIKDETFYIHEGTMYLELGGEKQKLKPRDSIRIRPHERHRFSSYDGDVVFFEFSTHDSPEDSYREENSGKIPGF